MAGTAHESQDLVEFRVHPSTYRHWKVLQSGSVATLVMDVAEDGGLRPDYDLKLNSYDLGVDIELYDAVQRLRFEHPEVRSVIVTSGKERVFCAGANIRMLANSTHPWKVNFCKFTNETRNGIEDASANSGQVYLAALNGTAAGGGYELALACDYIMLLDDKSSAVSLPELPLLAVLPGTGGLTRVVEKRHVRRDIADYFSTKTEGVAGRAALEWGLIDEVVPRSSWEQKVLERASEMAARNDRVPDARGISLTPLEKDRTLDRISYRYVEAVLDREARTVEITVNGPTEPAGDDLDAIHSRGASFWTLAATRELDDLILDLRINELDLGTWVFKSIGDPGKVLEYDELLVKHADDWFANEIILYLKRTLKRLDVTSRSLFALIEPGSCFVGSLFELVLAADRSFQLNGTSESYDEQGIATVALGAMNFGLLPMGNGLSRLETRFLGNGEIGAELFDKAGVLLEAEDAESLGLVTFIPDDIDWEDEIRMAIEERASFSPDALTGMEANYRFVGPETIETKIFARLSAWQNWIFSRSNAIGEKGALRQYGTGQRPEFDTKRV